MYSSIPFGSQQRTRAAARLRGVAAFVGGLGSRHGCTSHGAARQSHPSALGAAHAPTRELCARLCPIHESADALTEEQQVHPSE
eukprot:1312130-Prymnesium_polylepis.2